MLPTVSIAKSHEHRCKKGHPWIFSNEVVMDAPTKALPRGQMVQFVTASGAFVGTGFFNAHSLISGRLLTRIPGTLVDKNFLKKRLMQALALRQSFYADPYYRLVHAEADGLPGLVVDRFGDILSCQFNTAGMENMRVELINLLQEILSPQAIVLRNDSAVRVLEGMENFIEVIQGTVPQSIPVKEGACVFEVDLLEGQKTGWFFDQRENRQYIAQLCQGKTLLDYYCYKGGFSIQAAHAGASRVIGVDRSVLALESAKKSALLNGVSCEFVCAEAFEDMEKRAQNKEQHDVVVVDPPAFVKHRRDLKVGLKGYRKMIRLAAALVKEGGILFVASCSHHVDEASLIEVAQQGLRDANREGRLIHTGGPGPDHPVHPSLPESSYLKSLTFWIC